MQNHKIRFIIIFLALTILAILQISFLPLFFKPFLAPQLVLITLFAWTITRGYDKMISFIVIGGLLVDILNFLPVGISAFLFLATLFFAEKIAKRNVFLTDRSGIGSIATFALAAFISLIYSVFAFAFGTKIFAITALPWLGFLISSLYSALAFIIIYFIVAKVERSLSFYERKIAPLR